MKTSNGNPAVAVRPLDVEAIRRDFPILSMKVRGEKPLVYLDSAATSQKPRVVLDALQKYYVEQNANVHRGVHYLSEVATEAYEGARAKVAKFIGASDPSSVIFTRNATEAINLVAHAWGRKFLVPGDEVLYSEMEHHSNLVPWFQLAKEKGVVLKYVPVTADGKLDLTKLPSLLTAKTKLVALTGMSNVLGTVNPIPEIAAQVHAAGALLLVDGAQSVPHRGVDVATYGADFLAFSAHKMLGPTGIGVLWARPDLLESMDPFLGGGDMIRQVWIDRFTPNDLPWKFEAGTPNIADGVAFGAAIDYLTLLGMDAVAAHEHELIAYALEKVRPIPGVTVYGPEAGERGGVLSFNVKGVHPHDVGQVLDSHGVAIRAGHHCGQPLMRRFGIPATARASFYLYNTKSEVDALAASIGSLQETFGVR